MLDINQFVDIEETRRRNRAENSDYESPSETETDGASDADEKGNLAGFVVSDYDSEEEKDRARRYCRREARREAKRLGTKNKHHIPTPTTETGNMGSHLTASTARRTATEDEVEENLKEFEELMAGISDTDDQDEEKTPRAQSEDQGTGDKRSSLSRQATPDNKAKTPLVLPVTAMKPRWGFTKPSLGLSYLRKGFRAGRGARAKMLRDAVAKGKRTRAQNRAMDKHIDDVLNGSGLDATDDHRNNTEAVRGDEKTRRERQTEPAKVMTAEERAADREKKRVEREEALRLAKDTAHKEKEARCKEFDIPIAILLRKRLRGRFNTRPRHAGEVNRDAIRLAMGVRNRRELYIVRKVIRRVLAHHNVSLLSCWAKQNPDTVAKVCNQIVKVFRKNNPNWNLGMARVAVQHTLEDSGKTIRRKAKGYKSDPISYARSAPRPKKYAPDFSEHLVESEEEDEEAKMIPERNNGMEDAPERRKQAPSPARSHPPSSQASHHPGQKTSRKQAPAKKSREEDRSQTTDVAPRSSHVARGERSPLANGSKEQEHISDRRSSHLQASTTPNINTGIGTASTSHKGLMGPPPVPLRQTASSLKSATPTHSTHATPAAPLRNSYSGTPLRAGSFNSHANGTATGYRPPLAATLRVEYVTSFEDYTSRASFVMTLYKKHTLRTFVISIEKMIAETIDLSCTFFLYMPIAGKDNTWNLLRDVAAIAQMFTLQGPTSGVYMCHADYDSLNTAFLKNALDEFSLYSYFRTVKAESRTNVPLFEGGTYTIEELRAAQFMVSLDSGDDDPIDHVMVFESTGKISHEYVRSYRWQLLDEKDEDSEEGENANLDEIIERERASDPIIISSSTSRQNTTRPGRSSHPPVPGSARASVAPIPFTTHHHRNGSRGGHISASRLPSVSLSRATSRFNSQIPASRSNSWVPFESADAGQANVITWPSKSKPGASFMSPVETPRQHRQMMTPPDTLGRVPVPFEGGSFSRDEDTSVFDPSVDYQFKAERTSPLETLDEMRHRSAAKTARANGLHIPPDSASAVQEESDIAAQAREELRVELDKRFGSDVDIDNLSPKQWEIFRKLVAQKKKQIRKRKKKLEEERLQEEIRRQEDERLREEERLQEVTRQKALRRQREEEELRRKREETIRRQREEALHRQQEEEELLRQREETLRRQREEEERLRQREEAHRRKREEEERLRQEEEDIRRKREEDERLRQEEEDRKREERRIWLDNLRRDHAEAIRKEEEKEKLRRESEQELRRLEEEERIRREKEEADDRRERQLLLDATAKATEKARAERARQRREREDELAAQREQELAQQRAQEQEEIRLQQEAERRRRQRQEETMRRRRQEEEALQREQEEEATRLRQHRDKLDEALRSLQEDAGDRDSDDGLGSLFNDSDGEETHMVIDKASDLKVPVPKTYDSGDEYYDDVGNEPIRPWRNPELNIDHVSGSEDNMADTSKKDKSGARWPTATMPDTRSDYPDFAPPTQQFSQATVTDPTAHPAPLPPTATKKRTPILTVKRTDDEESDDEQEPRRPAKRQNMRMGNKVISLLTSPPNTQHPNPYDAPTPEVPEPMPEPAAPARRNTRGYTRNATNMDPADEPDIWWIRTPAELEFAEKMRTQNFPTKDDIRELIGFPVDRRKNTDKHRHALQAIDVKLKALSYDAQKIFDWQQFVWEQTRDMPESKAYQRSLYKIANPALSRIRAPSAANGTASTQPQQQPPQQQPQQSQQSPQKPGSHSNNAPSANPAPSRPRPPAFKDTPPPAPRKRGPVRRTTQQHANQPTSARGCIESSPYPEPSESPPRTLSSFSSLF
ncbi:hypothetical protein BJ508DRAFT_312883 [Ascobolus immersus RN42]|uniref:Uncharacterized protein n=1 Tax=Ascobolus immersus RN42 TaxID=1160509 RepID=A0A3N4HNC3_ASCIM|nr:hypothetical protein BJ508DRAFT_312883 [Ascobolus immersus RN42]